MIFIRSVGYKPSKERIKYFESIEKHIEAVSKQVMRTLDFYWINFRSLSDKGKIIYSLYIPGAFILYTNKFHALSKYVCNLLCIGSKDSYKMHELSLP